jgi:hypothetical protein
VGEKWVSDDCSYLCKGFQNINGVHYLLTKLGLSWISARSKHPKQDKEARAKIGFC